MRMYSPDAIHEFPFAPPTAPKELVGRESISNYMSKLPHVLRFGAFSDISVREIEDEFIIEAKGHHTRISDGSSVVLDYVWFIRIRNNQVIHIRDYMNPLQLASI